MHEINKQKAQSSRERHKQQAFWQIYFPLLAVFAGIGLVAYKLFSATYSGLVYMRVWADISTILLMLPFFLIILLLILINIVISVLLGQSGDFLRTGFGKVYEIAAKIGEVCQSACKSIQKIFIEAESYTSMIIGNLDQFSEQDQEE